MTRWLVVGGGSAGCVVAARLSKVGANMVTLVEAGPDHGIGVGSPGEPVLDRPERLAARTLVVRRPGLAPQNYAQGFGLGGSSLVNGGVVIGDPAELVDGHALPVVPVTEPGPVAGAVIAQTGDAAPVSLVRRGAQRVSAVDAYLRPSIGRENLAVRCNTVVERIVFDDRRAVGVVTISGDHFEADRVVLCAGAIRTPTLLLRSGVDTPGVGSGLQDHIGVAISFDLRDPSATGPAIGATVERDGRQIVVMDRLPGRPEMGAVLAGHLAVVSEGRVALPDPDGPPLVELNQLAAAADLDGLQLVVGEALQLLSSPGVQEVVGERYVDRQGTPASTLESDADALRAWLPDHLGGYHHIAGSCRIGVALDSHGALLGYDGLHVADASALPHGPPRNLYLTVIRQAEHLARGWLASP